MRRSARGFTLLEVLVALFVFGLLMAGLAQAVQVGITGVSVQAHSVDTHAELDATDRALRNMIGGMRAGRPIDPPNIIGSSDNLVFTAALPAAVIGLRTRQADMQLHVDAAHRLVLSWVPHLHALWLGLPPIPTDTPLLDGVERVQIAYWAGAWRSTWNGRAPPALVRLRLVFAPGDRRRWPDIVVAPEQQGLREQ